MSLQQTHNTAFQMIAHSPGQYICIGVSPFAIKLEQWEETIRGENTAIIKCGISHLTFLPLFYLGSTSDSYVNLLPCKNKCYRVHYHWSIMDWKVNTDSG